MKITIRWKMMASYLLLVLLMGGVFYAYLHRTLEDYMIVEVRENLLNEARLGGLFASRLMETKGAGPASVAGDIGRRIKARVTIIAADGAVAGDSEIPAAELAGLENHRNRPEFRQALETGSGTALRYSSTLRTSMQYAAVSFTTTQGQKLVLRLALPLSRLDEARGKLHALLGAAIAVAVIVSLLFSYLLSNVATRSLKTMAAIATELAKGNFRKRLPLNRRDELGEVAAVMNDMAVRIEGQLEKISAEKTRLDTILEGMGEGLIVTDGKGTITLINPAFRQLFTVGNEIVGKPLIDFSRHPLLHEAYRNVLGTNGEIWQEIALERPERTLMTHWVPLRTNDLLTGVVGVFHDITDIRKMERVRRDFVANVSHELRTPVTIIKGYAETLLTGVLESDPANSVRFVEIIRNHSERLTSLIRDLLTLSQLESGGIDYDMAQTEVRRTIGRACSLLEAKAKEKQVTLDATGAEGAPAIVADDAKLEQVFINLLDNALKYTPEGGRVTIATRQEEDRVRITVSDTGIGIPPKDLPRIFERFYRVDEARSRDLGGTGLGLSIVKHIVGGHGGTIDVTSTPGEGTTFIVTLPLNPLLTLP